MASTYSDLKVELIGTGEQVGTWGGTTNTNLGTALEEAITGSADITFSSVDVTLTLIDSNTSQTARHLRLVCTGTSGGARQLILGSGCQIDKLYLVQNDLADAVTIKNTTGTGVTVAAGKKQFVFNNGTNVVAATDSTVNLASDVTGTLPVANGGTGQTSYTDGQLLIGNTATGALSKATITAGSGIGISNGNGTITISNNQAGGTVTSVSGTGTASGLTLSGTVTTSGNLTLSGTVNSLAGGTYPISISGNASTASFASSASSASSASTATTATQLTTAFGSAPSYAVRAYVNFRGSDGGAYTVGNFSSITKIQVGQWQCNFTQQLIYPNFTYACSGKYDSTGVDLNVPLVGATRIGNNPTSNYIMVSAVIGQAQTIQVVSDMTKLTYVLCVLQLNV
jgi:hypothetical protein